jgi:hypothetical protein
MRIIGVSWDTFNELVAALGPSLVPCGFDSEKLWRGIVYHEDVIVPNEWAYEIRKLDHEDS